MGEVAKIDILIEGAKGAKTLGDLEESAEGLTAALKATEIGTAEYKKLKGELISTNTQVKNLELSFEALDQEQVASEIGSVAGAIGDVTSSIILLGGEDETLQQVAANIEKALGVSIAFKGAIEGVSSARKLLNNQIERGTKLGKAFTAVQRVLNAVMRANPIGLIITAIALLIGGFILLAKNFKPVGDFFVNLGAWVHDTLESFGAWKNVILILLGPIGLLIALWDFFFGEQAKGMSELQKQQEAEFQRRKVQTQKITADHKMRLAEIEQRRKAEKEAFDDQDELFDLEIARQEAQGKNAFALQKAKKEAVIKEIEDQLIAIEEIRQSWITYYEEQFVLSGKSREDFIDQLKGQGIDIVDLQTQLLDKVDGLNKQAFQAETELIKLTTAERQKQAAEAKKVADEIAKINDDARKRELAADKKFREAQKGLDQKRLDFIRSSREKLAQRNTDEFQQALDALRAQREEELLLIEELGIADNELKLQLERDFQEQLREIKDEAALADAEAEEEQNSEKLERNQDIADQTFQGAQELLNLVESINTLAFKKDVDRIKAKQARGEKLTRDEANRLKRQTALNKAFAVVQIAIDTAIAVAGAIAMAQSVPYPGNIVAMISGVAAVIAGIVAASAALATSPPVPDTGAIGTAAIDGNAQAIDDLTGAPNLNPVTSGSTVFGGPPTQVVVLESEITETQEQVKVIESGATFG